MRDMQHGISGWASRTMVVREHDRLAMRRVGLLPPKEYPRTWTSLGEVLAASGSVIEVEVMAQLPATFWRFTIASGRRYTVLETGAGTLAEFWPSAAMIAEGRLRVDAREEGDG